MSGDVGAEVAAVLATALHSGVCGPSGDVCCWTEELDRCADADLAGLAQHLSDALAPLIAAREEEGIVGAALTRITERIERLEDVADRWDVPGGSRSLARRARDKAEGLKVARRILLEEAAADA